MQNRIPWYEKKGISKHRFIELKAIARQYGAYRAQAENGMKDPIRKIRAIEAAAVAADDDLAEHILHHVSTGRTWEKIMPPCGRRQFYAKSRTFYIELNKRV